LAKVFKIHTYSCLHNKSKCYSSDTHPLQCLGSDKFYTGQTDEQLHSKTSALDGCQCLTSFPTHFNPGKEPWCVLNKMLGVLSSGVDVLEKKNVFSPYQDMNPGPSSRQHSLYTDHATTTAKQI